MTAKTPPNPPSNKGADSSLAGMTGLQRDLVLTDLTDRSGADPLPCDFLRQIQLDGAVGESGAQVGLKHDGTPATDREWLRAIEPQFGQPEAKSRLGIELEMFLFDAKTAAPLGTSMARPGLSSEFILQEVAKRYEASGQGSARLVRDPAAMAYSAKPQESEHCPPPERDVTYGLVLSEGLVFSIEPGGQLEVATPPHSELAEVARGLRRALQLVEDVTGDDVLFLSHGTNPLTQTDFGLQIPKKRYRILTHYLASEPGGRGIDMMRHAATVQPNIDVATDRASWQEAVRFSYALSPLLKQLFANSCFFRGAPVLDGLERQRIWSGLDPSRAGVPKNIAHAADPACAYACWASQAYVFLIDGLPEREQPRYGELRFCDWYEHGYKGLKPGLADWERHLATLFPEVRLRGFLELRMIDAQPFERLIPLMALVRGLLQSKIGRQSLLAAWPSLRAESEAGRMQQVFDALQGLADGGLAALGETAEGPARLALRALRPFDNKASPAKLSATEFVRTAGTLKPSLLV